MKNCSICGNLYPLTSENFQKDRSRKDGFRRECKKCFSIRAKISKQKNKVKNQATVKIWRESNKETIAEKLKIYTQKNREKISRRSKEYQISHREQILRHREENKGANKITDRIWLLKNKDKVRVSRQMRRARVRDLPHTLTAKQWGRIQQDFNGQCAYCGETKKLTIEHFIPLSKQGELTINNVLPICLSCNCSRNNNDFTEWFLRQSFYNKKRETNIYKYLGYANNGNQQLSLM